MQRARQEEMAPASPKRPADPHGDAPIIDGARIPYGVLRQRFPRFGIWLFAWLRVIRPILVLAFWLLAVHYLWRHFFDLSDQFPVEQKFIFYSEVVVLILVLMLALAPLRRREVCRETADDTGPATLPEISDFAQLAEDELALWRDTQRLVAHHDRQGRLDNAEAAEERVNERPPA
jgi:poly-beta-1,6-N-acetyl-D-glucosamine biosynthesis protein PgaD